MKRESSEKEFVYANNLVLLGDSREKTETRYARWKKVLGECENDEGFLH